MAKEKRLVNLLIDLGMPKNMARILMFLAENDKATSVEIEKGSGLSQPAVSITMRHIEDRSWVEKSYLKKDGKGRPIHIYKLRKSLKEIFNSVEEDARLKIEEINNNIAELRQVIGD
jgi:predicted transcriptional regulator